MLIPERYTYPSPGFSEYWRLGGGKKLLKKITINGEEPSEADVKAYSVRYSEYDSQADAVITGVFETLGHKHAHERLNEILDGGKDALTEIAPALEQLITEAETIPSWLDPLLMEDGAAFCRRTGRFALIVLRNYCLMGGYESSAINKPLIYTGALRNGAYKRMTDTLDFWVHVTGENAMRRFGPGFKSAVKVRIMHALARVYTQRMPEWSNNRWGVPVNQGDMVATNLGFSLVFLEGLRKQGFTPTEREINGLFHFWKYIGYLLGIPPTYLPDNEEEAIRTLYIWSMSQPVADEDTKGLAASLMQSPLTGSYPPKMWQKKLLVKIHLGYNYYFLGARACRRMSLPSTVFRYVPYIAAAINRWHEYKVHKSATHYQQAVNAGRTIHEIIRKGFVEAK